ncbi:Uncharacterised protein [Legionella donaldsonii]|uniref:Polysaccharide biosynthesis protein n=1 Tax=Legionella donaldsonii TaxID=45060 RepID=A0A378J0H6_9GAMM|nr:hypothetical protein [Legionella donaldsonii]STX40457.1 Uncharacterised protein [Legionella donaldsonii]
MVFALNLLIVIADQFMLFIVNMLVARHAGEELFGDFTVATNALWLLATIITFGIDSIIAYYVPKFYVKKRYGEIIRLTVSMRGFLKPIYLTLFVSGLLLSLALIGLGQALTTLDFFEITHPFLLFLWGTVALSLYNIFIQFFRAIDYMRTAVILSLCQTIIYFLLSLLTYFYLYPVFFHQDAHYFPHVMLIGFILSYAFILLISVFIQQRTKIQLYRSHVTVDLHKQPIWKEKMYGYTIQNLNRYIFTAIPLLVIEWLGHHEHSAGLFSAVTSIISLAFIAIGPIGILIGPDISAAFAQSRMILKRTIKKYLVICFVTSLVIVIIMAFFAKPILLLYKSNFINALPYTYICLINVMTYAVSMPLSKMIEYSHKGSVVGAKLTMSILLFQFISCLILIPWLDLTGAIICYVGINVVYNAVMVIMALRIYRSEPFDGHTV